MPIYPATESELECPPVTCPVCGPLSALVPIYPATESELESAAASFDKVVPPARWTESSCSNQAAGTDSTGFTVLSDPGVTPSGHLSHKVKVSVVPSDLLSHKVRGSMLTLR